LVVFLFAGSHDAFRLGKIGVGFGIASSLLQNLSAQKKHVLVGSRHPYGTFRSFQRFCIVPFALIDFRQHKPCVSRTRIQFQDFASRLYCVVIAACDCRATPIAASAKSGSGAISLTSFGANGRSVSFLPKAPLRNTLSCIFNCLQAALLLTRRDEKKLLPLAAFRLYINP